MATARFSLGQREKFFRGGQNLVESLDSVVGQVEEANVAPGRTQIGEQGPPLRLALSETLEVENRDKSGHDKLLARRMADRAGAGMAERWDAARGRQRKRRSSGSRGENRSAPGGALARRRFAAAVSGMVRGDRRWAEGVAAPHPVPGFVPGA